MVNELLVNLVDSILGRGKRTSRGNQSYHCPFCHHRKPKLEVNFTQNEKGLNPWNCWVCNKRGGRLITLFNKLNVNPQKIDELKSLVKVCDTTAEKNDSSSLTVLPEDYKPILNNADIIAKHALSYLRSRNVTKDDILKYNIGYCEYGEYAKMIIIPSYDKEGQLNYFTSRSFERDSFIKYRNPKFSRNIIPFELFINWNLPIILCEGPFDAIAIKRNVIPLLGKNIQPELMKQIVKSNVKKIYIALDDDALKQAIEHAEKLVDEGKEVYLLELDGKDPSEMGFKEFHRLMNKSQPLTLHSLMKLKISLL